MLGIGGSSALLRIGMAARRRDAFADLRRDEADEGGDEGIARRLRDGAVKIEVGIERRPDGPGTLCRCRSAASIAAIETQSRRSAARPAVLISSMARSSNRFLKCSRSLARDRRLAPALADIGTTSICSSTRSRRHPGRDPGQGPTAQKLRALERCAEAGVTVSLAAAVERGINEHEVGAILAFGVEHAAVTGVFFQPVTHSGRFRPDADPLDKLTNPDARRCRTAPRLPEQPRGARRRGTGRARGAVVGEGGGWLGAGCRAAGLRRLRDRHAARELGCRVVGLEYGQRAIDEASDAARAAGLQARVSFRHGDAEALHFESASFDAVLCECALCTFPDKPRAAHELRRVLRPGGRLALSDVVVEHSRLSAELRGPLATSDAIDLLARAREAIRDGTLGYAIFIAGD